MMACWVTAGCASQETVRGQAPTGAAPYGPTPYAPAQQAGPASGASPYPATAGAPPGYGPSGYGPPGYGAPSYVAPSYAAPGYPPPSGVMPAYTAVPTQPETIRAPSSIADGSAAPGQTVVLQVVIEGVHGSQEKKIPKLKTRSGEPYDPQAVEDDVKAILKTRKFVDVSPRVQPANNGVVVIFQVVERPVIHYIKIIGCEHALRSSLLDKTDLKVKDGLDPYAIKEARDKLESYYHDHGYDRVRVFVAEGLNAGDQGVVFLIDEGRKQKIWLVNFVGNTFETGARLATQIDSGPPYVYTKYFWGGFKGYADRKKIDEDIEKLTSYYRSFGYFQAKIGREWSFDEDENWMYLTFVINEGPRYKVRNISFLGNRTFDTARLSKDMKLHGNDFFNQGAMNKDLGKIRDFYGSFGFVFADIQADPRLLEESNQLDLVFNVKEGSRYRVGKINISITGESPHTSYVTILDRLSLHPGDIIDTTLLRKDERRLKGSGLYASDPNKAPKIVFSPPPGMDDPNKQLAERPNRRPGWMGGSSSSDSSGPGSSSQPFGPSFGSPNGSGSDSSSGSSGSGSTGSAGSNYRGQAPDSDPAPIQTLDVNFEFEPAQPPSQKAPAQPRQAQPQQYQPQQAQPRQAQQPATPVHGVEWIDPCPDEPAPEHTGQSSFSVPRLLPQQRTNSNGAPEGLVICGQEATTIGVGGGEESEADDESQGPIIRGQSPAYGGYNPGATGPDSANPGTYNSAPQGYGAASAAQAQAPYNPGSGAYPIGPGYAPSAGYAPPPGYAAQPAYAQQPVPQAPLIYNQQPPANYAGPGAYPQYPPTPVPLPGTSMSGGTVNYYQIPGAAPAPGASPTRYTTDPTTGLPLLEIDPQAVETQTGKLSIGVGVNSDAGLVGSIVIDEQNFDPFRYPSGWEDFRNGTAFRGGGDQLRIELAPGVEVQNYVISLRNPYLFDTPISYSNSIAYFERYYDNWTDTRVSYSTSLGYYFTPDLLGNLGYTIERVKISGETLPTPPEVVNAEGWSFENGPSVGFQHDTRDSPFLPGSGHLIRYNLQYYFGRFDYAIQKIDLRQYFTLGERPDGSGKQVLGFGSTVGFAGHETPVFDTFYAGGFSTLRGFAFRGVSPLDEGVAVGGDFEWLNTVEYNMPITADDVVRGVAFVDFGTVESSADHFDAKDIRVAPGVGLRLQIPALGAAPIALDLAFPLHMLPGDQGQIFSFSLGVTR